MSVRCCHLNSYATSDKVLGEWTMCKLLSTIKMNTLKSFLRQQLAHCRAQNHTCDFDHIQLWFPDFSSQDTSTFLYAGNESVLATISLL